jgi:hypothetical protein
MLPADRSITSDQPRPVEDAALEGGTPTICPDHRLASKAVIALVGSARVVRISHLIFGATSAALI